MAQRANLLGIKAPEFPRGMTWVGPARPPAIKDLAGKIVLIEFWTYSCVNCLRVLPYLKRWAEKYERFGFAVIGVHSPEFEFEKDKKNVQEAVNKFGVKFPVVLDNDYKVWNLYFNAWWPRKVLLNTKGEVVLDHAGEGAYVETESKIRELLMRELHWPLDALPEPEQVPEGTGGVCYQVTPELYLGYERGRIGTDDFIPDKTALYRDAARAEPGRWYASGAWVSRKEYFEHAANEDDAWVHLRFTAFSVNCVMESGDGSEIPVLVTLNGKPLGNSEKGKDVEILSDGKSVVRVSTSRMYNVFSSDLTEGELKLFVRKRGLRLFAFTFGGCEPAYIREAVWGA